MQANSFNHSLYPPSDAVLNEVPDRAIQDNVARIESSCGDIPYASTDPTHFYGHFENCMEMYADAETVARYLDEHQQWFRRCAHPMAAEPLGNHGYALTIGKFGSFGYEVEPKIGLHLLPQDQGVYRIETIDIPGYTPPGYDVDFRASLQLANPEGNECNDGEAADVPALTHVEWELDLSITIHFPRFINALPHSLIQTTGDRLLSQIVRQASKRLTYKVQEDFHKTMGIPFSRSRRPFWR